MNKLIATFTLLVSGFIASNAMAAPHEHDRHYSGKAAPAHWKQQDRHDHNMPTHKVNPSRQWRTGQVLPSQFDSKRYALSSREARHLPKTAHNQQWYKINGDYVLVNERSNRILRILS